jgi:flavin-dependent thymidylate synthase
MTNSMEPFQVLDGAKNTHKNSVELVGHYGGDETHALSAWTSTKRELTDDKRERMDKLLNMLAKAGHHTPFEKSALHFLVTCDTATHIHFIKHRIGVSVNAESARYKELHDDKFYVPSDWPQEDQDDLENVLMLSYAAYHAKVQKLVEGGMDRKRAKESARYYLPYGIQITLDVQFNFRSFMHFQGLRNKPDAQLEVREISQAMIDLTRETGDFDLSLAAFGY